MAIFERLNLKPRNEMIQNVVVVPRLAPMMTPIDWIRVRRRAWTKLTTMTVVAEEDWTRQVTRNPVITPANRFPVIERMILRSRSPENCWIDSLMRRIPNRNTPKLPNIMKNKDMDFVITGGDLETGIRGLITKIRSGVLIRPNCCFLGIGLQKQGDCQNILLNL